jgi:CoA:oxalate CoA-transferase
MPTEPPASPPPRGPLDGILVIDLSRVLAGPFCSLLLARLGARVIKVEMPGTGDDARAYGPFREGRSLYFESVNHGKESIALDLKKPADRETFEGLLGIADVLVENFRPGTMDRLGYGADALRERFPRLVYGEVSGFGATGPYRERAAYDIIAQALGGIIGLTGHEGQPSARVGVSIGDMVAGLYLTVGILGALYRRDRAETGTGTGTAVDVSLLDCQVALLEADMTAYLATGRVPGKRGSAHPSIAPFQIFRAKDGEICIAAGNDGLFRGLAKALGKESLADDPRFARNVARHEHLAALVAEMESLLAGRGVHEWLPILDAAGIPCAPIQSVADVARHPQVLARNMIQSVPTRDGGVSHVVGNPIKYADFPDLPPPGAAPDLDADRSAILALLAADGGARP